MANAEGMKEVRFDLWCRSCVYYPLEDHVEPCNTCLENVDNYQSDRPVCWKPKDEK